MSVLGGWGVSAPRFDTIQDWTSLTNVKPSAGGAGKTRLRRSVSTSILPSQTQQLGSSSSQMAGVGSPPGRGFGGSTVAQQRAQEQGTGRTPTSAFANNPYQLSRGAVNSAVASSLTGGSPTLGSSPSTHQFAIHQLPRAASSTGGRAASASVRRSASPIAIPAGGALPLSPSNSTSVANRRQTLIQQQAALSQSRQRADSMPGTSPLGSDGYNPYLLAEASMPASQQMFRKTKNLEQRLAEYLKPPRVSPNAAATSSPGGGAASASPAGSPTNARGNISVNVLLHPKTPLGSLTSPPGAAFSTVTAANKEMLARASAAAREEKDDDGRGSPQRGRRGEAIDEDELAAAQAAELMASVKKGKSKVVAAEEEAAAAAAIAAAAAAAESAKTPEDDASDPSANQAPAASMNLRAVLKEKKAQELEAKAAAARDQEAKKPWTGISWHDVVQARLFLLAHNKAKLAAQASGLPVPDLKEEVRAKNVNALALQVATNWLSSTSLKSAKKPFNIFTLSEFQRQEYKVAQEQGKWLTMVAKEDALKKELDYLPNDQKRISSKTRMMNMCKGEVTQQQASSSSSSGNDASSGSGNSGGGNSGSSSGGGGGLGAKSSLLYNTYVSCNGQYGYVRYVGRVSWGSGLWVGMELVEKHAYAASANAPWVDFYHEHSAVSMQLIEETAEQKAEQRKRVRALMAGTVADQIAAASTGGPTSQMMINTLIPRPLLMAAMIAPVKDKAASSKSASGSGEKEKIVGTAEGQFQPLANSIFPFIDVVAFLREGLAGCFEMQEVDPGFAYFAPMDSVRRVALKAKIDNKALLSAKEHQTNPFADVDDLATNTPKKHEGNIEMLARYLTVSDREVLDGDRNKARSIFRWICHNIRYDPTGTGAGAAGATSAVASPVVGSKATDVISIIRHRRATAEGFAQLFHALCVAGGLQCLRIRGVEKQLNQRTDQVLRNKHAWNAIKVDGEWSFVDCVFSCGQWVDPPSGSSASAQAAQALARASVHQGTWAQMFSDAYFCTPPSLFILEHFPTSCDDAFNKVLPQEYNNLQLLRSVVSASEFEKGLIPGRAFVEYQMRASPFTYAVECKQPSYQIEITAPSFILFDVDLSIKSHVVDLSQCSHIQYDGEQCTIYLIFPVPGEYVVKITCKPSWRELDIYEKCLTYRMTSHTGLVPLASNKDVIIGYLQHRKMNARDSRALFNRHFTLMHPLSGHLIPKAPFIVQLKGPEIADSVVVACNGDWQRLSSSTLAKSSSGSSGGPGSGVRMFEGTALIQPRYDLQIFYEHDKKFHLLFYYRANLTSFSNVYLEKDKAAAVAAASSSSTSSFLTQDLWHGKCVLGIEGRVFDANLSLDVPACKFGRALCIFIIHVSTAWDVALQVQEGWRNGTPLPDNQVVVEEMKNARTALMTQYKITTTLPATAMLNPVEEPRASPSNKLRSAISTVIGASSGGMPAGVQAAADFANSLAEGPEKRRALEEAERRRRADNKIPYASSSSSSGGGKDLDDAPKASTQYVLVINARNIKQGGPMRYCLSYFFDVAKTGQQAATTNQAQLQLMTED